MTTFCTKVQSFLLIHLLKPSPLYAHYSHWRMSALPLNNKQQPKKNEAKADLPLEAVSESELLHLKIPVITPWYKNFKTV